MTVQYGFTLCRNPACNTPKEPDYANRGLCAYDEAAGRSAIGALLSDWDGLQRLVFDKQDRGPGGIPSSGPPGPSEPIDYASEDLADEIAHTAVVWELTVREVAGLAEIPYSPVVRYPDLVRATRILTEHWAPFIALRPVAWHDYAGKGHLGDGVDGILALVDLHRRALSRIGYGRKTNKVDGFCGACNRETLRHVAGEPDMFCGTCHATWSWDVYQDAMLSIPEGDTE